MTSVKERFRLSALLLVRSVASTSRVASLGFLPRTPETTGQRMPITRSTPTMAMPYLIMVSPPCLRAVAVFVPHLRGGIASGRQSLSLEADELGSLQKRKGACSHLRELAPSGVGYFSALCDGGCFLGYIVHCGLFPVEYLHCSLHRLLVSHHLLVFSDE